MKKLFLFSVALLTSLMVGATIHEVYPNSPQGSDNIRRTLRGDYGAINNGDTLRLADGEYTESESITIDKAITLRAAEGAKPIVKINKWIIAAAFEVDGVEFTNLETDYMFRTSANLDATITLKNCYMHDSSSPFVYLSEYNLDRLFMDNCIFANNTRDEYNVVCASGTIANFEMRNSTIYNITGKYAVRVKGLTSAVVDHCTFYNCGKTPLAFGETAATNISVSNTTFSNPALVDGEAMIFYKNGVANNCVYFNTSGCATWMATQTNTINADPLFVDPANGNFNFAFTSPLFLAATNGTHIGDPRWGVAEPKTAIAVPDTLPATQAVLSGTKISATEDGGIKWNNNSANPNDNSASWVIDVNKTGIYKLIINDTTGSGHTYIVSVANAEGWLYTKTQTENAYTKGNHVFDAIIFNEVGKYMVRLKNGTQYSSSVANKIYLDYLGGAVVDVPSALPIDDAILSSGASRVEGYIDFASESNDNARWNIHVPGAIGTKVTIDVKNASGHRYYVYVYDKDNQLVKMVRESPWNTNEGVQELGNVAFPAEGNYYVIVADSSSGSLAVFKDLTFTYAGGAVVDIPDTLPVADAILSSGASINEDGYITYHNAGTDNARWNINATKAGSMSVAMDVVTTNGHIYMVALYSMEGDSITAVKEKQWTDANGTMRLEGTMTIPQAGNYYVVVKNTVGGSMAVYKNVTFTYAGGAVVTIPGTLSPADAMLSEKAFIDNDTIIFAPRNSEGYTPDGWAKWNVRLENDAICAFTANCHRFSGNSMNIKISVIDADNDTIYRKEESVENSGNSEVALGNTLLTAGDYVIQMQNTVEHSKGRLMSVVVESSPVLIVTDDSNIDFSNYADQTVNVQLQRTFKANMYNPICLPFGVDHSVLQSILKCETSYLLKSSSLEGQKLYVELEASQYNDIYNGSPYMIKPSEDVVNPLFTNVKIMGTPQASSSEKGVLKLQGSFIKQTIDNPQSSLLVGANNTLFFPNDETPSPYIKSMRAYFILVGQAAKAPIKAACFREPGNAPTWMPIVGAETEKPNGKFIRDGRFVIVREGKEYNAQGIEL